MLAFTTTLIIYAVLQSSYLSCYDAYINYHSSYICCVVDLPVRAVMVLAYSTVLIYAEL